MSLRRTTIVALLLALAAGAAQAADANLFAFVGQKIKVEEFRSTACDPKPGEPEMVCLPDAAFHAEYRVLQSVYGEYNEPIIRFDAFDHYGRPRFAQYEHVLLFVSKAKDGRWIHQKYQYFPVYETVSGGWAGCGSADRFEPLALQGPSTAQPIDFKQPVVESLQDVSADRLDDWFPATDWLITPEGAKCLRGSPLTDLFEARKRGVLKHLFVLP